MTNIAIMNSIIFEHLFIFISALLACICITLFAWKRGFYYLPKEKKDLFRFISTADLLGAFGTFLSIELLIIPFIVGVWIGYNSQMENKSSYENWGIQTYGWLNLLTIFFSYMGIFIYVATLNKEKKNTVFYLGNETKKKAFYHDILIGSFFWICSYPIVVMLSQLIELFLYGVGYEQQIDQVAVKNLKSVLSYPLLLSCTIFAVVLIVPIAEEILFRGFFQNWIITRIGRIKGIIATSILFASFHFSMSQNWNNLEVLLSLFVLSCYLGFVYERQSSLWASIALHSTFNAISVLIIIL